jgi:uncharacterized protein DUF5666
VNGTTRDTNTEGESLVKKFLSLLVTVAFVTGMVGFAAAQGTTTEKKAGDEKKAGEKMEKGEKKAKAKSASGTVKSASADSLVVEGKGKNAKEWTFAVDPNTKIKKSGKDVAAADLQAGDAVNVRYTDQDGKMVAQSVMVRGGKAKKGGDTAAKGEKSEKKAEEKK